jgi:hypothetical protein
MLKKYGEGRPNLKVGRAFFNYPANIGVYYKKLSTTTLLIFFLAVSLPNQWQLFCRFYPIKK